MEIGKDWTTDWASFIQDVAASFDRGLSDRAVTDKYAGQPVVWEGKIRVKELSAEYVPGVAMRMPRVHVQLKDGRTAKVDYLYLHLNKDEIEQWKDVPVGQNVRFQTTIASNHVVIPGIRWGALDEERGSVMVRTKGASLVTRVATKQKD